MRNLSSFAWKGLPCASSGYKKFFKNREKSFRLVSLTTLLFHHLNHGKSFRLVSLTTLLFHH